MNTVKLVIRLLQSGSSPLGFGDGFGGVGNRAGKRVGMSSAEDIARRLGRRAVEA